MWVCGQGPHRIGKILKFISESRSKSYGMDPQDWKNFEIHFWVQDQKLWNGPPPQFWHLVEILEILLLHVLSNDACKFAINLFPISWNPFENVSVLFFLLKMQIWNGCNVLNIAGNPYKDINGKLSFLSSGSKVVEWTPQFWHLVEILEILLLHVLSNDTCKFDINLSPSAESPLKMLIYYFFYWKCRFGMTVIFLILQETPQKDINANFHFWVQDQRLWHGPPPGSDIWWKSWKFTFHCRVQDQKLWNGPPTQWYIRHSH